MNRIRLTRVSATAAVLALTLTACMGGGAETTTTPAATTNDETEVAASGVCGPDGDFVIWQFEGEGSAMYEMYMKAIDVFEQEHPGVNVTLEQQTFEGIQQNAQIVLTGQDVPDLLLYNKGNNSAGQLAAQGLIRPLTDIAHERGWDQIVTGNLLTTSLYDENGEMGSGDWYGVPNNGEYVSVYYNVDMFNEYGIPVPTTLEEMETAMQTFVDHGIIPISSSGAEYPIRQLWYQLVLHYADQQMIDDFQLFTNDVDFHNDAFTQGTERLKEWMDRGFVDPNAVAITAEDMGLQFMNGTFPMMVSGSWWIGRLNNEMDAQWDQFLFPGNELHPGSAGNLWTIPTNARNPECAADFIDITLRPEIQNFFAEKGGLAINSNDEASISDPHAQRAMDDFERILHNNALAFYPEWPVAGLTNTMMADMQALWNGSKTVQEVLDSISAEYFSGRASQ